MDDNSNTIPDSEETSNEAGVMIEQEDTMSTVETISVGEVATPKLVKTASKRVITADTTHTVFQPEHILEYEWPFKSGERFFLQEQIAEFLDIKSFKRKYPDLQRRPVEKGERDYLVTSFRLGELMSDFQMQSLTAIRAIEVHELMSQDYSSLYAVYQKASADRQKRLMVEQQREFDTIKSDSKKMDELRKRAIKSASEFNSELCRDKQRERRQFWDMQTSVIQSSSNRWKKLPPSMTRPGPYPVALMPGQFHHNFKKFTSEQLREMPLNTVLEYRDFMPIKRPESPPAIVVDEEKIEAERERARAAERVGDGKNERRLAAGDKCSFCRKDIQEKDKYVQCAQCHSNGHPTCMDMSNDMYQTVKGYEWMCMDCKPCSVCKKLDEEDKMLFCDRCDRGYHTFCVGLDSLPSGRWVCVNFCAKNNGGSNGRGSGSATPTTTGELRCRDCDTPLNKDNKVHHRSKYRHSGLCMTCVNKRSA